MVEQGGLIVIEPTTWYFQSIFRVKQVLAYTRSKYQKIGLVELEGYGRALILDDLVQSSEADEFIYHESLVHPAMTLHPEPRDVLIIGGGEGATLREVLKHNCVKRAVMVDIDEVVVEFSKKYLEFMHQGSFYDPRSEVVIMDGFEYIKKAGEHSFDVVILDLTDPYASEIAKPLYSLESFKLIDKILRDDGIVVTQAGNSFLYNKSYSYVYSNIKQVFKYTAEYWVWVPTFAYACNFIIGSKKYNPYELTASEFDKRMELRGVKTRFINGSRYEGLLKLGVIIGDLES